MKNQILCISFSIGCLLLLQSCSIFTRNVCKDDSKADYLKSVDYFTKKVEKNPKNIENLYHLGMSYYKLQDYSNSIKTFDRLLEINPEIGEAISNRRLCKFFLKDSEGACKDFQKCVDAGFDFDIMNGKSLSHYIKENCNTKEAIEENSAL